MIAALPPVPVVENLVAPPSAPLTAPPLFVMIADDAEGTSSNVPKPNSVIPPGARFTIPPLLSIVAVPASRLHQT